MAFNQFADQERVVQLLQRSLRRGRLGHAYLFCGNDIALLEEMAFTLAKTLNCENPPERSEAGLPLDCCDACLNCEKIGRAGHPDVLSIRPESKLRVIKIDQIRALLKTIYLKPTQGTYKVAVMAAADRLNVQAANAFLKTLEEPPPNSILILLTTEPERLLDTILSRCLRLNFSGEAIRNDEATVGWVGQFNDVAAKGGESLLSRYQLLSVMMGRLGEVKEEIAETLAERSPLEKYDDLDPKLREKWEAELDAAVEAEYRRRRAELLEGVQWWLRDVWLATLQVGGDLPAFPQLAEGVKKIAGRIRPEQALENLKTVEELQSRLHSNVQEALAIEVGFLRLKL